ncbi:hypothetical protein OB955_16365 [Halobacteria archaeon AArc-m2/3/4]|uniref:Uncharacterized protein n=1 Tax=Natronoglomus mannanivorans TaxID=2979990 RepID=A0ABT2QHA2_9EURY|nr:hypothetical protein [Halobacteria archaeon AArc-m2/3/4]
MRSRTRVVRGHRTLTLETDTRTPPDDIRVVFATETGLEMLPRSAVDRFEDLPPAVAVLIVLATTTLETPADAGPA